MTFKESIQPFIKNRKWVIFWLFFFYPFGVYLMWQGKHFNPDLRWMISFLWVFIVWMLPPTETTDVIDANSCPNPIYADNCTYCRDKNNVIISQTCDKQ